MPEAWELLVGGVRRPSMPHERLAPRVSASAVLSLDDVPDEGYVYPLARRHNQAHAGSCTAHGASGPFEAYTQLKTGAVIQLSLMDIYYGGRWYRGWTHEDSGALIPDIFRWIREQGTVSAVLAPYNASMVTTWTPPREVVDERPFGRAIGEAVVGQVGGVLARLVANKCVTHGRPIYANEGLANRDGFIRQPSGGLRGYHSEYVAGWNKRVVCPGVVEPGALLVIGSWPAGQSGIAHPRFPDGHSDDCKWLPFAFAKDPEYYFDLYAPSQPIPVEV